MLKEEEIVDSGIVLKIWQERKRTRMYLKICRDLKMKFRRKMWMWATLKLEDKLKTVINDGLYKFLVSLCIIYLTNNLYLFRILLIYNLEYILYRKSKTKKVSYKKINRYINQIEQILPHLSSFLQNIID